MSSMLIINVKLLDNFLVKYYYCKYCVKSTLIIIEMLAQLNAQLGWARHI